MAGKGPLLGKYTRCRKDCRQIHQPPPWPLLPGNRPPSTTKTEKESRTAALALAP